MTRPSMTGNGGRAFKRQLDRVYAWYTGGFFVFVVALAILESYPDKRLHAPLILAIAYAASVGGLGTPIGSPPNLVFMQVYAAATGTRYGFMDWMAIGLPVVLLMLPMVGWWLGRGLAGTPAAVLPDSGSGVCNIGPIAYSPSRFCTLAEAKPSGARPWLRCSGRCRRQWTASRAGPGC